jgi:hypothetical protein
MKKIVSLFMAACSLMALSLEAAADEFLRADEYLFPGQRLVSAGCVYSLDMQQSGNLVIDGSPEWASNTGGGFTVMQPGGNLVIYDWDSNPVWASGTSSPDSYFEMQSDGNGVVKSAGGVLLWATNSAQYDPIGTTQCGKRSITTKIEHNTDRNGADYIGYYLDRPVATDCAFFCSQDAACRAFTYVPPGVQALSAVCWLKSGVPTASNAPGMVSGRIIKAGFCAHDACLTGEALDPECKKAVNICNVDPYCCENTWDSICVSEVRTVNDIVRCEEAKGSCSHTLCTAGAKLTQGCDAPPASSSCVSSICAVDPYCCYFQWDDVCIDKVDTICNKDCENKYTL